VAIPHLSNGTTPDEVAAALASDGCVVVDELASRLEVDAVLADLEPFVDATPVGPDEFSGFRTRRTGSLIARSPAAREFVARRLVVDSVRRALSHATTIQLHLTQLITIGPGEPAQMIHRDQWAYDFFTFPVGVEVQISTMWAFDDFTEENGATRVIPGSHLAPDKERFSVEDTVPAEMAKGSVLLYTGALYHGGGANRSAHIRRGCNIDYNVSWLRQEENQYLATPQDVARDLPDDLLRLMGYARGAYALGYVGDLWDPLDVLRGTPGAHGFR
jgi:ectoine hydroxylase-related dioxygenase (phytanoyl-CoA dioxygenase family)